MKINIITPCSRKERLPYLKQSILNNIELLTQANEIQVEWRIIFDGNKIEPYKDDILNEPWIKYEFHESPGVSGNSQRNKGLSYYRYLPTKEWIWFLDDDNVMYAQMLNELKHLLISQWEGIIVQQMFNDLSIRNISHCHMVKPGLIDTAQFILSTNIIEKTMWNIGSYEADGLFIKEIYNKHKDKFLFINKPLCFYNFEYPPIKEEVWRNNPAHQETGG